MRFYICFIAFLLLIIGCSAQHKTVQKVPVQNPLVATAHPVDITLPTYAVPIEKMQADSLTVWASSLKLICRDKMCPPQVGLLVFVSQQDSMIYFHRCTASLIAPDKIITNGHCDRHKDNVGYFITQKIKGKYQQIKIKDLELKQHTEGTKTSSIGMDVAIFKLQQSIDSKEIAPLQLPQDNTPEFQEMYAYVINEGVDKNTFVIDEIVCAPQRHEVYFPFDLSENPDTFWIPHCSVIPGNSGSPILASRTSTTIEALVDGFSTKKMKQEELDRPLLPYEDFDDVKATNLRCANIIEGKPIVPGCILTTSEEIMSRRNKYAQESISLINYREAPDSGSRFFKYEPYPSEFVNHSSPPNRRFLIYHIPKCRKQRENPKSVPFFVEDVELAYDVFARSDIKIIDTKEIQAVVTKVYKNEVFGLKIQWPTVEGVLESPPVSEQFGSEFNYSMPVCSN